MTPASYPTASPAGELRELPQSLIDRDLALWPRQGDLDAARVELFRELLAEPEALPPIIVVPDSGRGVA